MLTGMGSENHCLHFFCPCSKMNFVYQVYSTAELHLLPCFEHIINMVERQYGLKVRILFGDSETSVRHSDGFKHFINSNGLIAHYSPPHTQDQNGPAERSGGVLQARARNMGPTLPDTL